MKKLILFTLLLFSLSFSQEQKQLKIKEKVKYNGQQILLHKDVVLIGKIDSLTKTYVIDSVIYLEEKWKNYLYYF